MRILLEEGVAPEKIMIAHTGDTDDLDHSTMLDVVPAAWLAG